MRRLPFPNLGMLMGGIVVDDGMHVAARGDRRAGGV
jgi:hypothetical protein